MNDPKTMKLERAARGPRAVFGCAAAIAIALLVGCGSNHAPTVRQQAAVSIPDGAIVVPGHAGWVDSGTDLAAGQPVAVTAAGKVVVQSADRWQRRQQLEVNPNGTYAFGDETAEARFPLPAGNHGPSPCFALIGRIGDGEPFYIGKDRSWTAAASGRLWLRVNDFQPEDNTGEFYVSVDQDSPVRPVSHEEVVHAEDGGGRPIEGASVVVFYIDGLRPDVVREMAAMGHIPNIRALFVDGGAWLSNNFTAFPSDTITSNGTMWTGCFSDRHGIKGQVRFSRATLKSESYLDPLGPNRSARLLQPQGIDRLVQSSQETAVRWTRGEKKSKRWKARQTTEVTPLYGYLRSAGSDWSTGVLPLMTEVPPLLWTRSMTRELPYFRVHEAWRYVDDANSNYAVNHLIPRENPVTIVWLPETDSVSHKECRGQFGATRRTIARADELIGKVLKEIEVRGRMDQTYFVLVSDHGHHGGRRTHLTHFDIANEFFFKPREIAKNGAWVGGGLGLSVREHRYRNIHREDNSRQFVFIDGDTDGAARVFLPRGRYDSEDWSAPNRPGDLLAYPLAPHLPPINLVDTLTVASATHGSGTVQQPIDLVLVKLNEHSILISTADRGHAVITRKRNDEGTWLYRYAVVTDLQPTESGEIAYRVVEQPQVDPLKLLRHLNPRNFQYFYKEREWLDATARTEYPDSVVALTRHMLWQENLRVRESEFAPDLVVTAKPGWYFGLKSTPGTNHGYPLADSMRASFFVAGPNIRRGARIETATRLTDLTPTILDMVGYDTSAAQFDGIPLRMIYQPDIRQVAAQRSPVYWRDVDLNAWDTIGYAPVQDSQFKPFSVNRPTSPYDLNNAVYNVATISNLSLYRLFDDVLSPLSGGKKVVTEGVSTASYYSRKSGKPWVTQGVDALNVTDVTVGDYSPTSVGNLKRVDGLIDWTQSRAKTVDEQIADRVGKNELPGSSRVHGLIDGTQAVVWETYRFVQRVVVEVLDETVLNGLEDQTDRAIHVFGKHPAEIPSEQPGRASALDR